MNTNQRERFEDRLLVALQEVVAERAAAAPAEGPRAARWKPRLAIAVGATALAVAGVVVVPSLVGGENAYAVERQQDGTIRVEIKQVSDAQGLERRLADLGIPAEVDYLPEGQVCRQPRYAQSRSGATAGGSNGGSDGASDGASDGGGSPGSASQGDQGGVAVPPGDRSGSSASFTLRPADFAAGETLVIATAGQRTLSSIEVAVVDGPVLPCVPVAVEDQGPTRPEGAANDPDVPLSTTTSPSR